MFKVAAFYRFHRLSDPPGLKENLFHALRECGVKGSVLLATEGVNGAIAGAPTGVEAALAVILRHCGLPDLHRKYSATARLPFLRLKVRLKKEIVTIGNVPADPNEVVGEYVEPQDWNALISDPEVLLVDTRNAYEYRIGTFKGAIDPATESFGQFPAWVRKTLGSMKARKVATFCTGGIRCEKATSFMRLEGFEKVYHLKGGILRYLEEIPAAESRWQGGCFVFDERVAVGHGVEPLDFTICHGCLMPVSAGERNSPLYEEGVCCPACANSLTATQKSSNRERQKQYELAQARGTLHLGPKES
jgi:UPF0176 protein